MIKVCIADSAPVVSYGIHSYFKNHTKIECVTVAKNSELLLQELNSKELQIVVLDIELQGLSGLRDIKSLLLDFPKVKIILFTLVAEKVYAQAALKMGVAAYVLKTTELSLLEDTIINVVQNATPQKKKSSSDNTEKKSERLFKKVSNREIEVLRYLNNGKKNKEIAQILGIDEKTISTYKLRLLSKLNVTNLVDLLKKAKDLEII
jgi:DNA-binding NarL/FixJ family response regulator